MTTYSVTCPMTKQPIYFGSLIDLRAFVIEAMKKNKDCTKTIHLYKGKTTIGTMRRTEQGIVYRSSSTHKDHLLKADGTFKTTSRRN